MKRRGALTIAVGAIAAAAFAYSRRARSRSVDTPMSPGEARLWSILAGTEPE